MPVENESASVSPQKWLAFFYFRFLTLTFLTLRIAIVSLPVESEEWLWKKRIVHWRQ